MEKLIKFFKEEEEGATAVEYAIMVALITVVIIVTVTFLGKNTEKVYNDVGDALQG